MSTADIQTRNMIRNLETSSGVSWSAWIERARAAGSSKHGDIVKHLKESHGLGHGYANLVVHGLKEAETGGMPAGDDLVATMYSGPKAALRPIYEALLTAVRAFGADVEVAPKKTYVSLRRSKQFALVQPSTATRLDVGINLKGAPPGPRLEASGSFNAMVSHRVRVGSLSEVDAELRGWLRAAYEAAGPR